MRLLHLWQVIKTGLVSSEAETKGVRHSHIPEWETRPPKEAAWELAENWFGKLSWPPTSCLRDWRGWERTFMWREQWAHHLCCFPITSQVGHVQLPAWEAWPVFQGARWIQWINVQSQPQKSQKAKDCLKWPITTFPQELTNLTNTDEGYARTLAQPSKVSLKGKSQQ